MKRGNVATSNKRAEPEVAECIIVAGESHAASFFSLCKKERASQRWKFPPRDMLGDNAGKPKRPST